MCPASEPRRGSSRRWNRIQAEGIERCVPGVRRGVSKAVRFGGGVEATQRSEKSQTGVFDPRFRALNRLSQGVTLTVSQPFGYLFKLDLKRCTTMNWAGSNEADVQAPQPQAGKQARVPFPDEDGRRSEDSEPSPQPRSGRDRGEDRREVTAESPSRSEALPREARIRLGSDIRALIERGKRKRTKQVDVFFAASPASRSRLGLVVPKFGHEIVERNRVKRRLRELGRRLVLPALDSRGRCTDVLIRARRPAYEADFAGLEQDVRAVLEDLCSDDS